MPVLDGTEFNASSLNQGARRPDVFDRMASDHKRLRFLLEQLGGSADATPARPGLFDLFCDALEGYSAASEQSLYAEVLARAEKDHRWPARHAVAVHDMSELLTFELSATEMGSEDWRAGLRQLSDYLEDHFRVEADEIFPLARTLIDREAAIRLGVKYEQEKRHWSDRFGRLPAASEAAPVKHSRIGSLSGAVTLSYDVAPRFVL